MRSNSNIPVILAMVLAAALSLGAALVAVDRIEATSNTEIGQALDAAGHDWADISVDGLRVVMSGVAPDEATRFNAISVAGSVVDATRVIDEITVEPPMDLAAPDFAVEMLRNIDGISVIGLIPAAMDRDGFLDALEAIAEEGQVTDLLEVADFPIPTGWGEALDFSVVALGSLERAKVSVSADRVAVTAIAESRDAKRRVETALARAATDGFELALAISAPRPVITPFTLRLLMDEDGTRFDACSADTEEARAAIFAAATAVGVEGQIDCRLGLGTPSVRWADAAVSSIEALSRLGGGKLTISDTDVSLVALDTVAQPVFDREIGELEAALPEAFTLTAVKPEPVVVDGTGSEEFAGPPEFVATLSPEGNVQLRGRLKDALSRQVVDSFAHAKFGLSNTLSATRLDAELPQGWSLRVLAGLEAMSFLNNGAVIVQPEFLSLRGDTGNPEANAEIARVLSDRLGEGQDFSISVSYVKALDPVANLPTPEECVARVNAVLSEKKITFAPSSTDIEADALDTVDAVAKILRECDFVPMEIGGHTDSQGRESMNLRLSQARADAVLNAIMARRVLTTNLTAKGYGETVPVGDNDTEEGRELNRRIEFKLIDPNAAESAEATTEEGEEESENEQN